MWALSVIWLLYSVLMYEFLLKDSNLIAVKLKDVGLNMAGQKKIQKRMIQLKSQKPGQLQCENCLYCQLHDLLTKDKVIGALLSRVVTVCVLQDSVQEQIIFSSSWTLWIFYFLTGTSIQQNTCFNIGLLWSESPAGVICQKPKGGPEYFSGSDIKTYSQKKCRKK